MRSYLSDVTNLMGARAGGAYFLFFTNWSRAQIHVHAFLSSYSHSVINISSQTQTMKAVVFLLLFSAASASVILSWNLAGFVFSFHTVLFLVYCVPSPVRLALYYNITATTCIYILSSPYHYYIHFIFCSLSLVLKSGYG